MKSKELLHLQQQFLKALHGSDKSWLLNNIVPANGFANSAEVLDIYLSRAQSRTLAPLHNIFKTLRWLLGEDTFNHLLSHFYAESPGEPLDPQALAAEFAGLLFTLELSKNNNLKEELFNAVLQPAGATFNPLHIIIASALLDWECSRALLAPRRRLLCQEELQRLLLHRSHLWARPRLERGTIICSSLINLVALREVTKQKAPRQAVKTLDKPQKYIIFANSSQNVCVESISDTTAQLLQNCDGTHTIASLLQEGFTHGLKHSETISLISHLVNQDIIVDFQS
ncbi:MAG: DNA-binding domain-containing protein [Synechococcus lacustris]|nr:DNA-binding domain-containing protein [Synechococcus lacustris]